MIGSIEWNNENRVVSIGKRSTGTKVGWRNIGDRIYGEICKVFAWASWEKIPRYKQTFGLASKGSKLIFQN